VSERPDDSVGSAHASGVTDEVTPDPGSSEAQEIPPSEALDQEPVSGEVVEEATTDDVTTDDVNTEAVNDSPDAGDTQAEHPDTLVARERLADLQRLQAEYVNYKRRVDRDRALVQERVIADVLDTLLPVLDDIHAAREHGDLAGGPFASIADKLESSLGKFGLERYGAPGEAFDPAVHEALLHAEWDGSITPVDTSATTIVQVLQPGYRTGQRVIRPARVSVADPS
jgi:molecular chaperone GrpE